MNVATQYLASDRTRRVNYTDRRHGGSDTRTERVGHLVRGEWTLCGRRSTQFTWVAPDDRTVRCDHCSSVPDGHLTHHDMCAAGITYRQLDYWCRRGWLRPDVADVGSGTRRTFPPAELHVARVMGALTSAGIDPAAAERVARGGVLAPGVTVVVDELAVAS